MSGVIDVEQLMWYKITNKMIESTCFKRFTDQLNIHGFGFTRENVALLLPPPLLPWASVKAVDNPPLSEVQ